MNKTIIIAVFNLITLIGFSQEHGMVWYFGNHSGLDFSSDSPQVLVNNIFRADAGCASISDNYGNLLFYTNGKKVWNRSHNLMVNGDSLNGSQLVNQNSIIVPLPSSDSIYYLFTISDRDTIRGFNYSIIDMSIDGGMGEIIEKNTLITTNVLEKVTAVKHCNNNDYWIIIHGYNNCFYSYLLSDSGLSYDNVKSEVGSNPKIDIGYLKVSPSGNSIVLPVNSDGIFAEIFNFNNRTGVVSQPIKIFAKSENTYCYGIEFSPDGNVLYLSTRGANYHIWQYNIRETNESELNEKVCEIGSGNNFAMQLAPNKKIYIASENSTYLNAINSPNILGSDCDYEKKAVVFTQSSSLMGLPNFVQSWFYEASFDVFNTCFLDTTTFVFYQNVDSVNWRFYENSNNSCELGNNFTTTKIFEKPEVYNIELSIFHCGILNIVNKEIEIFPYPISNLISDATICNNCTLLLDAGANMDNYLWFDESDNRFMSVYKPGKYWVEIEKNGCSITDTSNILSLETHFEIPTAFTPNGDGLNDDFMVVNTYEIFDFNMQIQNRYGVIVFNSHDILKGWDGSYLGRPSCQDTFVWIISFSYYSQNGILVNEVKKGLVTLIR